MNRRDGIARSTPLLVLVVVLLATAAATLATRQAAAQPAPLLVATASDLRPAFEAIGTLFQEGTGQQVVFVFGSSGMLTQQLEAGAPYDVFASADPSYIDALQEKGRVIPLTRGVFALGRIVLAVRSGSAIRLQRMEDILQPSVRFVTMANPDHAPYGMAARQALRAAGVWEQVKQRIVYADNAAVAVRFLETGSADAGIVPLSLAKAAGLDYTLIDVDLYDPLQQMLVVVQNSKQDKVGREFLAFVNSPPGQEILSAYGYVLPGEH